MFTVNILPYLFELIAKIKKPAQSWAHGMVFPVSGNKLKQRKIFWVLEALKTADCVSIQGIKNILLERMQ